MTSNTNLLSENQALTLDKETELIINAVDLNYLGTEQFLSQESLPFVLDKERSVRNAVLFWLASESDDYIRQPGHGGPLVYALGKTQAEIEEFKNRLATLFQENFGSTLLLADLSITPDQSQRIWRIRMTIIDQIRREVQTITVGVSL